MTQDDGSRSAPDASGRALWLRAKAAGRPAALDRAVDDAMIAAWLDGRLGAAETARVERHLAGNPQALQAALDVRNALADAVRAPVPDRLVTRAQALAGFPAERGSARGGLAGLLGGWRRALEMAAVGAAFVIVIAGGFSLGDGTQEAYARSAQGEVAVDFVLNPLAAFRLSDDLMELMNERGGR